MHISEIFIIIIIIHETLRNNRLVNSKISLILAKIKIKMREKSNICLMHEIKLNSVLTHRSGYHNDKL
jgi:hypothetical protein